ncbi:hypothetical protein FRX31_018980 [Thalictrum thalictroides]|uniref:Ubiquitin-like domain-containing protein n=1 Tax=Thalictrum thalictroides TaxID=46969 RepID=A0A7J6W3A7_THATH|nr:hypothetical protein FRX31_018980 [Thalictrum thalictroides]
MKVKLKADLMYRSINYGDQVLIEGEMTTVGDLKLYIEKHYDIPILNQILYYNGQVLAYNHVRHLSDVLVSNPNVVLSIYTKRPPELVRVHVVINEVADGFYLNAHTTGTVLDLKDEKFGLSPHRQKITMIAKDPLHDWEVVDNYMIQDCPTIYLEKIPMDQEQLMHQGK